MKSTFTKIICLFFALCYFQWTVFGQDTFSIVAVDPDTGEIGSAGASCVDGAANFGGVILLSGIIPGKGAVNAQAWICINPHINLDNAIDQMDQGLSPEEIIDWLVANDECNSQNFNPAYRQYGIVDLDANNNPRSAAWTGSSADDWKGHLLGDNYAIQGNILLGSQVLDSMEARFLATQGSLAEKLMGALQGANMPGADERCLNRGTSSTSAFLRVFKPDDDPNEPYLELNVAEMPFAKEPIDSIQTLFDEWFATISNTDDPAAFAKGVRIFPNPAKDYVSIEILDAQMSNLTAVIFDTEGREISRQSLNTIEATTIRLSDIQSNGVLIITILDDDGTQIHSEKVLLLNE